MVSISSSSSSTNEKWAVTNILANVGDSKCLTSLVATFSTTLRISSFHAEADLTRLCGPTYLDCTASGTSSSILANGTRGEYQSRVLPSRRKRWLTGVKL